ncbi:MULTISPECIES: LemA family protein [Fusobacterium]|mgnify:CR=1 FL=1|jgi:LemA protein|uniref:LemA family protein n=1 Tax=Fusobacterium varium ATCC 27725 TaxID=469618 RepID=A0ABM6U1X0_FUSVA|nr:MULTISPECIES: LemA family protein [Fusobacterium]AVQ30284.1 LemA family protein [Fusobacterium varium ATCC 27725]EES64681.1 LemA family protein [Fusobacterium varium ATCC 27725]RHG38631.1 LemA family protein [Fusobacterium varium]UYI78696.1 MAG: LemA family protein [Fusobacterium varium]VEH37760.1 LemA family [Fusobacterium varium]
MSNMLNELDEEIREEGRDTNVIAKQIKVEKDPSLQILICVLYLLGLGLIIGGAISKIYYIIPIGVIILGIVYSNLKKQESYFNQLEQRIQQSASQIDNYLEQRVIVLQNTAKLVEKAVDLDKSIFSEVAKLRTGGNIKESERNEIQGKLEKAYSGLSIAVENYPDLKSHMELRDAMQQNLYLQREITAAREVYNDSIGIWNREIFEWPFKKYIAAKKEYTTRIPFIASKEIKQKAKEVFF